MSERADVPWRDLAAAGPRDAMAELLLPVPWIGLAVWSALVGCGPALVLATLVVFMFGVRLNHGAIHGTLGLSPRGDALVMATISVVLGGATHALAHTHRIHHARCLLGDDLEGRAASYGFWHALVRSPWYPVQIHLAALRDGGAQLRRWIAAELAAVALVQLAVWTVLDVAALRSVALTLLLANAAVPMVGIWAVHRGCDARGAVARTSRSRWLALLAASMFFHDEHHRYPAVPTRRLAALARRLDRASGSAATPRMFGRIHAVRRCNEG